MVSKCFSVFSPKVLWRLHEHLRVLLPPNSSLLDPLCPVISHLCLATGMLHLHLGLSEGAEECYFLCWAWKKENEEEKEQRKRERERKRLLQRPLGIGWFVVRLGRNLKREKEGGAGGGLPLSFLPLTKLIQPLPRGNSQSGTHLDQNRPKKHKNKMAEP